MQSLKYSKLPLMLRSSKDAFVELPILPLRNMLSSTPLRCGKKEKEREREAQACLQILARARNGGALSDREADEAAMLVRSESQFRKEVLSAEALESLSVVKEILGMTGSQSCPALSSLLTP